MVHRTVTTQFTVLAAFVTCGYPLCLRSRTARTNSIGFVYRLEGQRGQPVTLDKFIVYATSLDTEPGQVLSSRTQRARTRPQPPVSRPCALEQRSYLADFWE